MIMAAATATALSGADVVKIERMDMGLAAEIANRSVEACGEQG